MNKIRLILRMHLQGYSKSSITQHTGVARNTVKKYLHRFTLQRLSWEDVAELSDFDLDALLTHAEPVVSDRYQKLYDFLPKVDHEVKLPGGTRQKMWEQYRLLHPDGYLVTQFCHYYRQWLKMTSPVMHMVHKVGDKLYVDYAGEKLSIIDKTNGEIRKVEVFVAILGASQLTYIEATYSQKKEDFITACENALHYIGGVPKAIVPDNLKAAVTKSSKYEPTINQSFEDFAEHYQTALLPARAYRPRDKALVEGAVKIMYMRVYAALRAETFFSLAELNAALWRELDLHNNAPFKGRPFSRRQQFEEIERSALGPLPMLRYEFKHQQSLTVAKNCYICLSVDKHYYSVPYIYIGKKVKVFYSSTTVEIYYLFDLVASHARTAGQRIYTTVQDHLASQHRFVGEWSPEKFIGLAESIHPSVKLFITRLLEMRQHPEQGYKSCMGVLSFAKRVGHARLIAACERAIEYGTYSYRSIVNIIDRGLDSASPDSDDTDTPPPPHDNIRGNSYYK